MRPIRSARARHQLGLVRKASDGHGWWVAGLSMSRSKSVPRPLPAGLTTHHHTNYRAPAHLSTQRELPAVTGSHTYQRDGGDSACKCPRATNNELREVPATDPAELAEDQA